MPLESNFSSILEETVLDLNETYPGGIGVIRSWYTFTEQNLTDIAPVYLSSFSTVKGHSAAYQLKTNSEILSSDTLIDTMTDLLRAINSNLTQMGANTTTALTGFSMVLSSEAQ